MKIKNSENKLRVALLGFGLDNQALLSFFDKHKAQIDLTICDFRDLEKLPPHKTKNLEVNYRLGKSFNHNLGEFDLLFRAPGWPISCPGIQAALKEGSDLSSPLNLFFELCPSKNIIGISGTKGKGTTATLIYKSLQDNFRKEKSKQKVFLGGNIGITPISFLEKIKKDDFIVLELSSFQLEDLNYSPKISVLTNLFKEHLSPADPNNPNYHTSLNKYWQAKLNIAKNKECLYLVTNKSLEKKLEKEKIKAKKIYFSESFLPSKLSGDYNRQNIAAAFEVAKLLKIKKENFENTIKNFKNLEHRLEFVIEKNGVKFFDNSFSTTPESTALDLLSFNNKIIQIAGGADKGADFSPLAKIIKKKVSELILLPGAGTERLKKELKKISFDTKKIKEAKSMEEAVKIAKEKAEENSVVLLSTACASFGLFKNYKERGDLFKKYVRQK